MLEPAVTQPAARQPIENNSSSVLAPTCSLVSAPSQCNTKPREHDIHTSLAARPVAFHAVPLVTSSGGTPATDVNAPPWKCQTKPRLLFCPPTAQTSSGELPQSPYTISV